MPDPVQDRQIANIRQVLAGWDDNVEVIDKVRGLERPTVYTPAVEVDKGYYKTPAVAGYQQLLEAYKALDTTLTADQQAKIDKVLRVQDDMIREYESLGNAPSNHDLADYSRTQAAALEKNGEVYLLSGHRKHFNITRIQKTADGGYTYTLYDSGHESAHVGMEGNRMIQNAVMEHRIKPGTNIAGLIEADAYKSYQSSDSVEYKSVKSNINKALEEPPVRAERAYGQRKGNCTTRGQRIMLADILRDDELSEKIYDFVSDVDSKNTGDIKKSLEQRLSDLQQSKDSGIAPPQREMNIESFVKAKNPENFESCVITLESGAKRDAYRTKPGAFSESELRDMHDTLRRNGVAASVRESASEPGKHYLFVREENKADIGAALAQDKGPAAAAYREYGERAPEVLAPRRRVQQMSVVEPDAAPRIPVAPAGESKFVSPKPSGAEPKFDPRKRIYSTPEKPVAWAPPPPVAAAPATSAASQQMPAKPTAPAHSLDGPVPLPVSDARPTEKVSYDAPTREMPVHTEPTSRVPRQMPAVSDERPTEKVSYDAPTREMPVHTEPAPRVAREMPAVTGTLSTGVETLGVADGVAHTGMGAAGVAMGIMGMRKAAQEGDIAGLGINAMNAALGATQIAAPVLENAGARGVVAAAEKLPVLGAAVMVADGVHQVMREKGSLIDREADGSHTVGNKGERLGAVAVTTGVTVVAGAAVSAAAVTTTGVAAVATAAAATGLATATVVAAAATLGVGAVAIGAGIATEKIIETHRAAKALNHEVEHANAENAKGGKRDAPANPKDGEAPSIYPYKHIGVELLRVSGEMKDENMAGKPERTKDGKISIKELSERKLDMRDPKNRAEFKRVLTDNINRQQAIVDGKAPGDHDVAKMTLSGMQGAQAEMGMYEAELVKYKEAHPAAPAAQGSPKATVIAGTPTVTRHHDAAPVHQDQSHKLATKVMMDTGRLNKTEAKAFIQDIKHQLEKEGHHLVDGGRKTEELIAKTALQKMGYSKGETLSRIVDTQHPATKPIITGDIARPLPKVSSGAPVMA